MAAIRDLLDRFRLEFGWIPDSLYDSFYVSISTLSLTSRTIIRTLVKEMWMGSVPIFHRLHRRLALQC